MSEGRRNNRRRRTPSVQHQFTSMVTKIIKNVSTCLIGRIIRFRDFCTRDPSENVSESHHDSESDVHAPPPPKRRCIRTSRCTNYPDQTHGSSETPTTRNGNPNLHDAYPSISTGNGKRDRTVILSPTVYPVTSSTIDEANDIDWSSNTLGNVQHSRNNTSSLDKTLEYIKRRRVVTSQNPGPSGSRMNHYKTINLVLPSQAKIMRVKNKIKPQTTPIITSPAESEVMPGPSAPEENSPPTEIPYVSTVYKLVPQKSTFHGVEVFTEAVQSSMEDNSVIINECETSDAEDKSIDSCHQSSRETPKPSSDKVQLQSVTVVTKTSGESPSRDKQDESDKFNKLILASREKWECAMCLVRNERSTTKCICCGSLAPNSATNKENSVPSFNFGAIRRLDFQTDKSNSPFLLKNHTTPQQKSIEPSTPSPVDIDPPPVFSFDSHNADATIPCNPSPLDVDNPPPALVLTTVPLIDSNPLPLVNIKPAPTQLPIPTSPLLKRPNTSSSTLTNIVNIVNSNLVFGPTNIDNLDSNRERTINPFDMHMPVNVSESNTMFSVRESHVINTAQSNNLVELLKTTNEANIGIMPQAGSFGQPAKRKPTVGLVFNFGQPHQQPRQQPQPMQVQQTQDVTAIPMSQPISAQEMIQQPTDSQAMGL